MASGKVETILIVEDDLAVVALERAHLEAAGYMVLTAATEAEAVAHVRGGRVDLMLLAERLSGNVDGLGLHARLKAEGHAPAVILVAASPDQETVVRALGQGMLDVATKPPRHPEYLPALVQRVTHLKRTESQLAESNAWRQAILGSVKDAILIIGPDRRIIFFNPAAERMFRCPATTAVGQPLARFMPREYEPRDTPADAAAAPESVTVVVRSGNRGIRWDGEEFPLEASIARVEFGGRRFHTVVVRDVTERARAEERLRQQAALLDEARDAIMVRDLAGQITYWNAGAHRLYGWSADEAVGRDAAELLYRKRSTEYEKALGIVAEWGEWMGDMRQVRRDGKEVVVESRWTLVPDAAGRPSSILVINTNVTERKRLEEQLRQAQKMEAVGQLAGGVAHDFNNLLTVITGYGDMVLTSLRPEDQNHMLVREILRASERAASLTRQLLAFSRKQVLNPVVLDLNALVTDMQNGLRRLIGEDIDLATALDPALGPVKADPGQVEQVIMNLAVNARDAMPTGGHLTLETSNVKLDEAYAGERAEVRAGSYARLAVSDTGVGMDEQTRAHIFEPFFTTKGPGKGTGLGLSTVYGIVKQSGGHIEVYSEPERGTTFKVYLPHIQEAPTAEAAASPFITPRGTETVLLVEDDEAVRNLARIALESNGYTVLVARDGQEALTLLRGSEVALHLLVTDVVMPKMSGRVLAQQAQALRPTIRVLYLSGYTDDAVLRHGVLESGTPFLHKPFTPATLARKVREVLDQR